MDIAPVNITAHEKRDWKLLVCMPKTLKDKLDKLAFNNSVSRNDLLVQIIQKSVDKLID